MKTYTDLKQSKKLAEFLPLESADMIYPSDFNFPFVWIEKPKKDKNATPCWSLAALMNLLPEHVQVPPYLNQNKYRFNKNNGNIEFGDDYHTEKSTNLFDAVFEMICWLKENNKL